MLLKPYFDITTLVNVAKKNYKNLITLFSMAKLIVFMKALYRVYR